MEDNTQQKSDLGMLVQVLAGLGIAALVAAAVWIGVILVRNSSVVANSLAGAFTSVRSVFVFEDDSELALSVDPGVIKPEETFTLTWDYTGTEEGSFAFLYACTEDVYLTSEFSTNANNAVFCNTSFAFVNEDDGLTFTAFTTEDNIVVPLELHFTPNGEENPTIISETSVTISTTADTENPEGNISSATSTDDGSTDGTNTGTSGTTYTPTPPVVTTYTVPVPTSNPNGTPDLIVRELAVGTYENNRFVASNKPLDDDDTLAVKFEVLNVGDKESGYWHFTANLPTRPSRVFDSRRQDSLFPNDRIEYILAFDRVKSGKEVTVSITIDNDDEVNESNENNNTLSIALPINQYGGDNDAPEIEKVHVDVDRDIVTIDWKTDERATTRLYWSTDDNFDKDDAEGVETDSGLSYNHEIVIDRDDLIDDEDQYYFIIESEDADGNVAYATGEFELF